MVTTIERKPSIAKGTVVSNKSTDAELISACQRDNKSAFNLLLKRYEPYVYGILNKIADDRKDAHEDYCQEVFMRVYMSIRTLRNPVAFKRWLHQLVSNLFYDDLRKTRGYDFISLDEPVGSDESSATREIADYRELPDVQFERREIIARVTSAIELLPQQFQKAIELREFSGLHYDAIAEITNTDLGTVKSRIARARARMQVTLVNLRVA